MKCYENKKASNITESAVVGGYVRWSDKLGTL